MGGRKPITVKIQTTQVLSFDEKTGLNNYDKEGSS